MVAVAVFAVAACDSVSPTQPAADVALISTTADAAHKSDVCHVDDEGVYRLITIADAAYEKHIGHGDQAPLSDIADMPGYVLSATDCSPEFDSDAYGDVTWTAASGTKPGFMTQFYVNDEFDVGMLALQAPAEGGETTLSVECVLVSGNEVWVGGTVATATGIYDGIQGTSILYWFQDNDGTPDADELGGWGAKDCSDAGVWRGTGVVTAGDIVVM